MQSSIHRGTTSDSRYQMGHKKSETHPHPPPASPTIDANSAPDTTHKPCACHPAKSRGEPSSSFPRNELLYRKYQQPPAPPSPSRIRPCHECVRDLR